MQPRNNPLRTGRRRGHGVTNKTPTRPVIRQVAGLPPAKTRNARQTRLDVEAQARQTRRGVGQKSPISAYRQGKRTAKRKPEAHRSKRNELRMGR